VIEIPVACSRKEHAIGFGNCGAATSVEEDDHRARAQTGTEPGKVQPAFHNRSPKRRIASSRLSLCFVVSLGAEAPLDVVLDDVLELGGNIRAAQSRHLFAVDVDGRLARRRRTGEGQRGRAPVET